MSARTFADAAHKTKRWFAFDSGAVARKAKRVFLFDSGGIARLIFSGEDDLSMSTGTGGAGGSNGYVAGGFGALTPNTLGDGAVVTELAVGLMTSAAPHQLIFAINGYPGTITQAYLTSLSINNLAPHLPGDSDFTSFTGGAPGGSAQWIWQNAGIPTSGVVVPVAIVRT